MLTDKNGRALAIGDDVTIFGRVTEIRPDVQGAQLRITPTAGPGLTPGQILVNSNVVAVVPPDTSRQTGPAADPDAGQKTEEDSAA